MKIAAPHYPLEGVVSWNMNTTCNYRCSYCTQRFLDDRKRWARDLPRFVAAFTGLPGDWEIKLSGGEPFRHPSFDEAVQQLAAGGLRVSVVTNLSASRERLEHFAQATRALPGLLSASLHLEYVDAEEFLDKVLWFSERYAGRVVVTTVATRSVLHRLTTLQHAYTRAGVRLRVQPEKQDRDVIAYTDEERAVIASLGGHNGTGSIAPNLAGRGCWAGARYFIVDDKGEAYRCYPARRYKREHLGNVLDAGFAPWLEPRPCSYAYCNCTVPQQRGMVSMFPTPPEATTRGLASSISE